MSLDNIDKKLWFKHSHCDGEHYFIGNSHTFNGRLLAWCKSQERSFFTSKDEIEKLTTEAEYWLKGYLNGNEPAPPTNINGDVDFDSEEYKKWKEKIKDFYLNGLWTNNE